MPTTANRGYNTPIQGTEVDAWGNILNDNFELISNNLGGVASVSLTNVNVILDATQYQCGTISLSGALSGNVQVFFPNFAGWWTVQNLCTGNFYVAVRNVAGGFQVGIPPGEIVDVLCDGTNMFYRNLGRIGSYLDDAGSSVPLWVTACNVPPLLLCDGSTFSSGTYPFLFAKLGTTTLPDFRGSMSAYLNGGTGRITTAGSGVDGNTRFSHGGAQNQTILQANLPALSLPISGSLSPQTNYLRLIGSDTPVQSGSSFNVYSTPAQTIATPTLSGTVSTGGSGTALTIMPPVTIAGIRMIYAG